MMKKVFLLFVIFIQIIHVSGQNTQNTDADSLILKSIKEMTNNIQASLVYAQEALLLQQKEYGIDSPQYDIAVSNLAFIYTQNNEYDKSIELRLKQLERNERIYGKESTEYAKNLYELSHCYHMLNNYQLAIEYGELSASIYRQLKGSESPEYNNMINLLVYSYKRNKDYAKIIPIKEEQRIRYEKSNKTDSIAYGDILILLCECYFLNGSSEDIIPLVQQALDNYERNSVDWFKYQYGIIGLTSAFMQKKEYDKLILIKERQLKYLSQLYGEGSVECGDVLIELCQYYPYVGEQEQAIIYGEQALDIFDKTKDEKKANFDLAAMWLEQIYRNNNDYRRIITLEERKLCRNGEIYGTESLEYASILDILSYYYCNMEEYDKALDYIAKAIVIIEKEKGNKSKEYVDAVSHQILVMKLSGKHDETKDMGIAILKNKEELLDINAADYLKSKYDIAREYAEYEKVKESIRIIQDIISYLQEQNIEGDEYATALETLANYQYSADNFTNCMALFKEALAIREKNKDIKYVKTLTDLSKMEHRLGQHIDAIETNEKALEVLNSLDINQLSSFEKELLLRYKELILSYLAGNYYSLGNRRKGGLLSKERDLLMEKRTGEQIPELVWLELENEINGVEDEVALTKEGLEYMLELTNEELQDMESYGMKNTADYFNTLGTGLGSTYMFMKDYATALKYIKEGLSGIESIIGKNNLDYKFLLEMFAICQQELNNKHEAVKKFKEALAIQTKLLPKDHPDNLSLMMRLAILEYSLNSQDAITYSIDITEGLQKLLLASFAQLTTVERSLYWNKYKQWFFNELPNIAYKYGSSSMHCATYNGILLSKGLMLNSEIEISRLIAESGDEDLLNKYYKLCISRSELNNIKENNRSKIDSLENIITEIEKDLLVKSKAYGDYTSNLAINWQQVKQKLGNKDIAVEFVSFPHTQDSTMYVAYILKSDMTNPQMVSLFEAKELAAIHNYKYYTTPEVSKLVWEKLDKYLNGCDNIYFAPAGELYNIAIESLPDYNGDGLLSDRYNLYRLSSTRELAVTKDKNAIKEAILYGGLKYDTDTKQMEADSKRYKKRETPYFELFNIADSLNLRSGASYLPATKIEAENINKSLAKTSIHSSLFTDTLGTEASFKDLSGKKMNLLHIATHGFYWNEHEAQQNNNMSFLMLGNDRTPRYVEDKALTRSGLLFSGANNTLTGKALPEDVEDGILTAKEISILDLRGLDLVVLSACQTGLGEITGDGVFGLQRGFKKAGANTLMMSLWKVDDNATQLLMSRFYENLIASKNKYEALCDAQRYVREYEIEVQVVDSAETLDQEKMQNQHKEEKMYMKQKPYKSPEYWAAFILLDAVN